MARYYQRLFNHGKLLAKEHERVGQVANYLEEFMERVPETFLDYERVESMLREDLFHKFVAAKLELVYQETMERFGHLLSQPKYHPEHGSASLANSDELYDEHISTDTDL